MQFIHQPLTWAFFLVLVPLLIHLINLMRQRKVSWAAMDFLLSAYKKHRKWIWLKQFLLLLTRMLAIGLVVAMLAKLVTRDEWSQRWGGRTTHHYVLLDDSFSMGETQGTSRAYDRAQVALGELATRLTSQQGQRFTLLRMTRASGSLGDKRLGDDADATVGLVADVSAAVIDDSFPALLEEKRRSMELSQLAVSAEPGLALLAEVIANNDDEQAVLYILSDFRADPWSSPSELHTLLQKIEETGAEIHLVRCVTDQQDNLAITRLEPAEGTRAQGVPLMIDVTVRNFGQGVAERVPVQIHALEFDDGQNATSGAETKPEVTDLPTLVINTIQPGESVTRRVQVSFKKAGQHVVQAALQHDPLLPDNRRQTEVTLPRQVPVLVVDGDPKMQNARYLTNVFNPSPLVKSGIHARVEPPSYLRDCSSEELESYHAVYLLDTPRLDDVAKRKLESYVTGGGGLAIFMGPQTDISFYKQWYDGGRGLFPVELARRDMLETNVADEPDVVVGQHPLFRMLLGENSVLASSVHFQSYLRSRDGWQPPRSSTIEILARLSNHQPLVVERAFGAGRVVTFLSTLSPTWNNWAVQPSFVVFILELHVYLDTPRYPSHNQIVGSPIEFEIDVANYRRNVRFTVPGRTADQRITIEVEAEPPSESAASPTAPSATTPLDEAKPMQIVLARNVANDLVSPTSRAGRYDATLEQRDGTTETDRYVLNVDTRESDLTLASPQQMASKLGDLDLAFHTSDELAQTEFEDSGFSWSMLLLAIVTALLLFEQLLGYWASYHSDASRYHQAEAIHRAGKPIHPTAGLAPASGVSARGRGGDA